jgi:hypothetical protein
MQETPGQHNGRTRGPLHVPRDDGGVRVPASRVLKIQPADAFKTT